MKNRSDEIKKSAKRELEYLIWIIEEKLRRTNDEEIKLLLEKQLTVWKNKISKNERE